MNWRILFLLSLLSIFMGVASVLGLTGKSEWIVWLCVGVFSAWQISIRVSTDLFLYGFYLGILDGIFNSSIQAIFISTYLTNNPRMVEALHSLPQDLNPALVILIMGPIIGVVSGVVFGILCVIAGKIRRQIA